MADEAEALDLPRSNFAGVDDRLDRIETRSGEMTMRLSAVERDLATMKVDYAATQLRLDNMDRGSSASNDGSS